MKNLFLICLLTLTLPTFALAQTNPLNPALMPKIDTNPADYPSNVWVTGSLAKVFQNTGSPGSVKWAVVYATQNEFQAFQIHVQAGASPITGLNVTMSDLVNSVTGTHISASSRDIVVYREAYLNITRPSTTAITDLGTGVIPEILIPAVDPYYHQTTNAFPFTISANNNQSVWVDVHIPPTAPSGWYSGTATVSGNGSTLTTIPVVYGVWQWPAAQGGQLPSTSSFVNNSYTNWSDMCVAAYGAYAGCSARLNSGGSSDTAINLFFIDLANLMLDHRYTSAAVQPQTNAPGANFEQYYGPLLNGTSNTILPGAKQTTIYYQPTTTGNFATATVQAWTTEFQNKGWLSTLVGASAVGGLPDEPASSSAFTTICNDAATAHAAVPPLNIFITTDWVTATTYNANAPSCIDWFSANIANHFELPGQTTNQRSLYNAWKAAAPGRKLLSYQGCSQVNTCANGAIGSGSTYFHFNVDATPASGSAQEWYSFLNNMDGETYYLLTNCWGSDNQGGCGTDPWTSVYAFGNNGDGILVYPGTAAHIGVANNLPVFLPGIRLKYIRDGMQDWEIMRALTSAGQGTFAISQVKSWMTSAQLFNNNALAPANGFTGDLADARQAIGTALHQLTYPSSGSVSPPTNLTATVQ